MKDIEPIPHAFDRLRERKISLAEIRLTVKDPIRIDTARPNAKTRHERKKYIKKFGDKLLCVVAEDYSSKIKVITVYWKAANI